MSDKHFLLINNSLYLLMFLKSGQEAVCNIITFCRNENITGCHLLLLTSAGRHGPGYFVQSCPTPTTATFSVYTKYATPHRHFVADGLTRFVPGCVSTRYMAVSVNCDGGPHVDMIVCVIDSRQTRHVIVGLPELLSGVTCTIVTKVCSHSCMTMYFVRHK